MVYRIVLLWLLFFLVFCDNKNEKRTAERDSLIRLQQDSIGHTIIELKSIPENAPEWYDNLPERVDYLYVSATARSKRASIAEEKAEHTARAILADKIKNISSSSAHGGTLSDNSTDKPSQVLYKSIIKKRKRIKEGEYWRVFVLIEMKINTN